MLTMLLAASLTGSALAGTPTEPRSMGEARSLWVGGGPVLSSYAYEQDSLPDTPLLPETMLLEGARPLGLQVGARWWFADYVGAEARTRLLSYTYTAPELAGQTAPDTLIDAYIAGLARYPFWVGSSRLHVGARVSLHVDDFLTWWGSFDEGVVEYEALFVSGLGLGVEVGGDLGIPFFVVGVEETLAGFTDPYRTVVDLRLGAGMEQGVYGALDMAFQARDLDITDNGEVVGDVSDRLITVAVSAGYCH